MITHLIALLLTAALSAAPGGPEEPVRFIGDVHTSNSDYESGYHDGQLPPAIGVQNRQILRANRTHPEWSDGLGFTYNHAPMLAYANGQFYCQYLNNVTGEHIPPGMTMLVRSKDGMCWTQPQVIFPVYAVPNPGVNVEYKFMHQRMGFYIAPNGRFLTFAFYGSPYGDGVGRVVREIYPDDTLSPIYFIRVNDNWEGPVNYPMYTKSGDAGFVEACESILNDKIRRVQWWEEDRFTKDRDEFYRVTWGGEADPNEPAKAFCFYTRDDGTVVGFFKSRWVTTTRDRGETWSPLVQCKTLTYGGAKIWAQRLDSGQYALVYNPTDSMARHPLSVTTSDDGILYETLANVHGEVPPKRFWGREKRPGAQYVRGIIEGNGNPPGDDLWVVYSVNKEDLWISRVPIPVRTAVTGPVHDDFSKMETGGVVTDWNIYSPQWCPVEVVDFPSGEEKSLRLADFDPCDYAKAVRVFEKADRQSLTFDLWVESPKDVLDIEVLAAKGERLVQLRIDKTAALLAASENENYAPVNKLTPGRWHAFAIDLDAARQAYSLTLDGGRILESSFIAAGVPERIEFRTGPYRLTDDVQKYKSGSEDTPGWDEPGCDEKVPEAVFYLRDFRAGDAPQSVLNAGGFRHHIEYFNGMEEEGIVNAISNADAWEWMAANVPLFECPDKDFEQIYYYRWWTFRKHLKSTPDGFVFTEFLDQVGHSGKHNTISCALGHHIAEGTWLRDKRYIDQYARFWFSGNNGSLQPHLHKYSHWAPAALYRRALVTGDRELLIRLLDAFVKDYELWIEEKGVDNGLVWQYDVRDGMEESISGGRRVKNIRPPLNSYLYANARAIAGTAEMAGNEALAREYSGKAAALRDRFQELLWNEQADFFTTRYPDGTPADVREAIGFIPWCFNLPEAGYERAWLQLTDEQGFWAPMGLTTAERRHPAFRSHGEGTCEWDGAVWPFATSQTLTALANLLRDYEQEYVSREDYFNALVTYARSHRREGKPYIGEYLDETTGRWLKPDAPRSRYYNHSTFCDLVITGPVGLIAREDDTVEIDPLLPPGVWDWFCLDGVNYHGRRLTILWDRNGSRYGKGKGLFIISDGDIIAHASELSHLTGSLK